jgi:hypothetical protein
MLESYCDAFSTNPTSFPRFRQCPPEIRLMIWQFALPGPRTIHLVNTITSLPTPRRTNPSDDDENTTLYPPMPHTRSKLRRRRASNIVSHCTSTINCPKDITSLLHTCRESRLEVLCRYERLHIPRSPCDPLYRLHYFDPLIDGIFVDDIWPWVRGGSTKCTGLFNARHLSISCNSWFFKWAINSPSLLGKAGLLKFKHLEELHIVFRILTDHEREKIMQYKFGQYMGPGDLTQFLYQPDAPHNIAFPSLSVDIQVAPILERFAEMKRANPTWNIPKVKLVAWATRLPFKQASLEYGDITK